MHILSRRGLRVLFSTLAVGLALAGCGGSDSGGSATMRLLNLTTSASAFDLVDADADDTLASAVAADQASGRSPVNDRETAFELRRAGNDSALVTASWSLTADTKYTAIAYGAEGSLKMAMLEEDEDTPEAGKARLRLYNTSADSGTLDLYLTDSDLALEEAAITATVSSSGASGFVTLAPGTYRLRLTASGDATDLRLDLPSVTVGDRGVVTLVLTAGSGGVLVHAATLEQEGGLTAYRNPSARVRLAAGTTGNASVTTAIGGTTVASGQRSPSVGSYRLVPAGNGLALATTVNGTPLADSTVTLKAGGDYTLLVHGDAAAADVAVLGDDNRLPTTTGHAKIRLINALAALEGGLTLNVDYSALAIEIASGTASDYGSLAAVTDVPLEVISPLATTALYAIAEADLSAKGVYTVFMLGSAGAPYGMLRRDR